VTHYLNLPAVVVRYGGTYSAWTIREKCRRGEWPHLRHPGRQRTARRGEERGARIGECRIDPLKASVEDGDPERSALSDTVRS
jgi:hypothetical protein